MIWQHKYIVLGHLILLQIYQESDIVLEHGIEYSWLWKFRILKGDLNSDQISEIIAVSYNKMIERKFLRMKSITTLLLIVRVQFEIETSQFR